MEFIPFWFEANQAWGRIDSLEEWKLIINAYKSEGRQKVSGRKLMEMANATIEIEEVESGRKEALEKYIPNFGLYAEHKSSITLEAWAKKTTCTIFWFSLDLPASMPYGSPSGIFIFFEVSGYF